MTHNTKNPKMTHNTRNPKMTQEIPQMRPEMAHTITSNTDFKPPKLKEYRRLKPVTATQILMRTTRKATETN